MLTLDKTNVGTIYCVGRNYALHAKELNNPIPKEPVIFTKTRATLCAIAGSGSGDIELPRELGRVDHELEIVIRIGEDLYNADRDQALAAISHYGLGLDLTLREKQSELKKQGYPWDLAKNFVNACPIAPLIPFDGSVSLQNLSFAMTANDEIRQQGNSKDMLFDVLDLLTFLSAKIPLIAGDIIMTGTPEGVGPLHDGEQLCLTLEGEVVAKTVIKRS